MSTDGGKSRDVPEVVRDAILAAGYSPETASELAARDHVERSAEFSLPDLRTAAIEAAAEADHACCEWFQQTWGHQGSTQHDYRAHVATMTVVVDVILPLLVAGMASRIADAIEAETTEKDYETIAYWCGYDDALGRAAAIARRVGETS